MPSSRQAPSIAPRPSAADAAPSSPTADSKALNPRILRKREADRKCQRLIRERTKSRIADLEATVKEYERKDASGLSNLMKQLADARQERDALAKKVKNIESVLNDGRLIMPDNELIQENSPDLIGSRLSEQSVPESLNGDLSASRNGSFDDGVMLDIPSYPRGTMPLPAMSTFEGPQTLEPSGAGVQDVSLVDIPVVADSGINSTSMPPDQSCQCLTPLESRARKTPFNVWRYANDVLSSRFQWPVDYNNILVDNYKDDVPVRVVVDGWDAVERRGPLHPSWQILKRIDQAIFWKCEPRERLAVLCTMHVLFQSHSDLSVSELPTFFWKGPSELDPQSYAINYFTWPGVRQKFFENQHRYCTNDFWSMFTRNLRILWPFEFRDCYTRNTETGLYTISPLFQDRINDINCWTMGPEMLQRWPDFRSDIPTFSSIPASVPNNSLARLSRSSITRNLSPESVHQSVMMSARIQDQRQGKKRSGQNQSDPDLQQVIPAAYDQMMWNQIASPQYSHFDYTSGLPISVDSFTPHYV